jgi:hypothetical protein
MAKMTPEGKVKQQIDKLLKKYGVWYFKPVNNGMGSTGIPDYICCIHNGGFLAIEAKADATKKPTDLQQHRLQEIEAMGGASLVIHKDNLKLLEIFLELASPTTGEGS